METTGGAGIKWIMKLQKSYKVNEKAGKLRDEI